MSTEPGHSNSETHMTMDGKPDARFKEVGLSSLHLSLFWISPRDRLYAISLSNSYWTHS